MNQTQDLIVIFYYTNMKVYLSMNYRHLFTLLLILGNYVIKIETFEPITTGALTVLGVGLIGSGFWAVTCKFRECCDDGWVHFNATGTSVSRFVEFIFATRTILHEK